MHFIAAGNKKKKKEKEKKHQLLRCGIKLLSVIQREDSS